MKKLLLCLAIILGSFIANGQDTADEKKSFTYKVLSITQCFFKNGKVVEGETTYLKDYRIVYVDQDIISVYIKKTNITVTLDIQDFKFDDGNLVYNAKHRLTEDKVVVMVKRFENGIYTFSFINFNDETVYIYKVEYFE